MRIVVRVPNWIGDVMFALPALESLKANHPGAEIRLAGAAWVRDLLAGEGWGENVLPIGRTRGRAAFGPPHARSGRNGSTSVCS